MQKERKITAHLKATFFPVLIAVLILANVTTATLYIRERKKNIDQAINIYPLIDLARHLTPQEHFIIDIDPLREELNKIVDSYPEFKVALYFEFLNTGGNIQINPNLEVWPASLLKVPLGIAVMKKIENKEWSLDSELVLTNDDRNDTFGEVWKEATGARFTIRELLSHMLSRSDNTAYGILLRNLPREELFDVLVELGLDALFNEEGKISVKEYSRIFRSLYTASFLSREYSQDFLELLTQSEFKDFLNRGIPDNVPFAHKFGIREDVFSYLDSGIVYFPNRPYLLTVAVSGNGQAAEDDRVRGIMEKISKTVFEYVSEKE